MPNWEGIEDGSPTAARIWLCRDKDEDVWKPLRKADCKALNSSPDSEVLIEGGRATADPNNGVIRYNFYNSPKRQLSSATWFVKEEGKSSKEFVLLPMSSDDAALVEDLYQRVVEATSSLGNGLNTVSKEEVVLKDDDKYKVVVLKIGNTLQMKKKPTGWFGSSYDLQRGYGEYTVEGEEEEMSLGPVRHCMFVIHGIGEAMWSRDDVGISSLVGELNRCRLSIQRRQLADWKKECEKAKKAGLEEPPIPDRIELLPIEWYDHIHSSSSSLMKSLQATTIQSIPSLRAIANDVIFDVLMYMTPAFCESVLESVTAQIDSLFHGFNEVHPDFLSSGGQFSLVGHSLGSVIAWDLLSILKDFSEPKLKHDPHGVITIDSDDAEPVGYQAYATRDEDANVAKNGSWGPSLPKPMKKPIPFVPAFSLFLGSPLGLFLTLRGAHAVFDEMRQVAVLEATMAASTALDEGVEEDDSVFTFPLASPFTLPSGAIYNIFHPSDPVAYRIEPLLLSRDASDVGIPPPLYLVKQGQGVRLHVKAMQLGDNMRRSIAEATNTWSTLITSVTEQAASVLSKVPDDKKQRTGSAAHLRPGELKFPLGGKSDRVDFQLQPAVIDNEYIAAVTAHSAYFGNPDVLDFVIDLASGTEKSMETTEEAVENTGKSKVLYEA